MRNEHEPRNYDKIVENRDEILMFEALKWARDAKHKSENCKCLNCIKEYHAAINNLNNLAKTLAKVPLVDHEEQRVYDIARSKLRGGRRD